MFNHLRNVFKNSEAIVMCVCYKENKLNERSVLRQQFLIVIETLSQIFWFRISGPQSTAHKNKKDFLTTAQC